MSDIFVLVTDHEQRTGKKNPFWQMDLKAIDASFRAVMWDVVENEDLPHKGDLIKINLKADGVRDQRDSKYNNIILTQQSILKVTKDDIAQEVKDKLFDVPKATDEQLQKAYNILKDKNLYKDQNNYIFVMTCLAKLPKEKLFTCPAARSVHHAFQGGLIVHTAELVQICAGLVAGFPYKGFIDQDVVFAGATLHDIGKVFTYGVDEIGQPSSSLQESTIGHIYYGMRLAEQVGMELKTDKVFLNEVLHVIASHHGRAEFGAIVEPATLEAIMVSQADFLGSRAGIIDAKLSAVKKSNGTLEEEWRSFGNRYVMGSAIKNWFNK